MRFGLLTILIILTVESYGQHKVWKGDTLFWYKQTREINNRAELEEISHSNARLAFRFSTSNKIIDLWTLDNETINGLLTLYTSTVNQSQGNKKPTEFFFRKSRIGLDTAKLIFDLLTQYKILEMPMQDSIKGWGHGDDGTIYLVEYSTSQEYSFKTYWTPSAFETIGEANSMAQFISRIETILNLKLKSFLFFNSLPAGNCYRNGSMAIICRDADKPKNLSSEET